MNSSPRWNLLTSNGLRSLDPPIQLARLGEAYLDAALTLCNDLATRPEEATFERGTVVLYLAAHALELFLKGAIRRKAPAESFGHDLEHIHNRYRALYPAKRFALTDMPFRGDYPASLSSGEIADLKRRQPDPSELFRYPLDQDGVSWQSVNGFEASSFLTELMTLSADFKRILSALDD